MFESMACIEIVVDSSIFILKYVLTSINRRSAELCVIDKCVD